MSSSIRTRLTISPWFVIANILSSTIIYFAFIALSAADNVSLYYFIFQYTLIQLISVIAVFSVRLLFSTIATPSIPSRYWIMIALSNFWSTFWLMFTKYIGALGIELLTVVALLILLLQLFVIKVWTQETLRLGIWMVATGGLVFFFAVYILYFLDISAQDAIGKIVWALAVGLGSTLILRHDP